MHGDFAFGPARSIGRGWEVIGHPSEGYGVVVGDRSLLLLAEDLGEGEPLGQRHEG